MAVVLGAAPSAFADQIDDAAAKLSSAAYPLLKYVNWNNGYFNTFPVQSLMQWRRLPSAAMAA